MKRMFRVVLAFVVVAWGLTLPAMETVSAQVAEITKTATDTNPLAGKEAAWTRCITVGDENVEVSVYKDFAYGERGDALNEGENYPGHYDEQSGEYRQWVYGPERGNTAYHRHRTGQYFDLLMPSNVTETSPVLVYLHGGSWCEHYDKDGSSLELLLAIAAKGYVVITADYLMQNNVLSDKDVETLREGATFAAILRDIDTLVSYLKDFLPAIRVKPTKLAIGGASAGGHLSSLYAYDQANPSHLGLDLDHKLQIAVELDLVGPTDFSALASAGSVSMLIQFQPAMVELMRGLAGVATDDETYSATRAQMVRYSPRWMVTAGTPKTIAAYALTDPTATTDGAVDISNYVALTNALAKAGVEYLGHVSVGVNHGQIDVDADSVKWIVEQMDHAKASGWYDVADENQDPDDPPPSDGLKMADFAKKFTVTMPDTLKETLTDFPLLVRLDPEAITDFTYDEIYQDGKDIAALDANGQILPVEVVWNPKGVSLLWVKVPELKAGTEVTIVYGTRLPTDSLPASSETWSGYAGVWHMDETEGTAVADSAAVKDGVASSSATVVDGVLGKGRSRGTDTGTKGPCILVDRTDKLDDLDSTFTVSGWVKFNTAASWGYLFGRKSSDSYQSWGVQCSDSKGDSNSLRLWSNGTADNDNNRAVLSTSGVFPQSEWKKYMFVYTESTITLYVDGVQVGDPQAVKPGAAVNGSLGFAIGGLTTTTNHGTLPADHDEVKLRKGAVNATWAAVEYAQETAAYGTYSAARPIDASAPVIGGVSAQVAADGTVTVSVAVTDGEGTIGVVYNADEATAKTLATISAVPATFTDSPAIPAGAIWSVSAWGVSPSGTQVVKTLDGGVMNAAVTVAKTQDADENGLKPGILTLSRPASAADLPLAVNLVWTSDGEAGVDYVADLPSVVTIPAGETSTVLTVTPIMNGNKKTDTAMSVTVAPGAYISGAAAGLAIKNLEVDADFNTWIAAPESDGLASTAANWSQGVPQAGQNILFDGRFSTKDCTWDIATDRVASWTQNHGYTGIVTIPTVYDGKGPFTCLTVTGAMTIESGVLTHPQSRTMGDKQDNTWDWLGDLKANETYRLRLDCGSLTIGANGKIDVQKMGYYASHDGARLTTTSHGGVMSAAGTPAYGNPKEPIHIGLPLRTAGNYYNGKGGGAIYITVTDAAVVNGVLSADSGNTGFGAGAAGSVYLKAKSVTGTGTISAYGTATGEGNYKGTGGRIALVTETPVDRSTFTQITAAAEWKNAQGGHATNYGGAGTVVFIDRMHPNGILVVAGKSDLTANWSNHARVTPVGTEGDWTFDAIEFGHGGRLSVPQGTTLKLPNGLDSITSTAATAEMCGLMTEGGTLDIGTKPSQTMSGNWMLYTQEAYMLNANITLTGGATIGVPGYGCIMEESATLPDFPACHLSVNGNLTVDATGRIKADNTGFRKSRNNEEKGLTGYLAHGGRTAAFGKTLGLHYQGYDSIFNPSLPGCTVPFTNGQGAGQTASVLDLAVTGTLTVDGSITADATYSGAATHNNSAGPGGSIKVTAGALAGSGTISANGARNAGYACGGGGRIAIRLTDKGATFAAFEGQIMASGRYSGDDNPGRSGSAGTVYLQTAAEAEGLGTIRIANLNASGYGDAKNPNTTEMASLGYGGDEIVSYKRAKYSLGYCGRAAVNADLQAASVELAETTAALDLEGHKLTVNKLTGVDGEGATIKVKPGTYTAADLAKLGLAVIDSSADENGAHATGTVEVTGGGITITVK